MIQFDLIRNPLQPQHRERQVVQWTGELTVRDLVPDEGAWIVHLNDLPLDESRWGEALPASAYVRATAMPQGAGVAAFSLFGLKAGATAAAAAAAKAAFLAGLYKTLALVGLNLLLAKVLGPKLPTLEPGDEGSPTYRFGGIGQNRNGENAVIPVVFGEHDAGGLEIASYVEANGSGDTFNFLLLLSEGPVESIGGLTADADNLTSLDGNLPEGLKLNGQLGLNFDDITASVRLGSDEQEPIPGFELSVVQFPVDQTATQSVTPGPGFVELAEGTLTPGVPAHDAELAKWDTAITYDMTEEADQIRLILNAPKGLYTASGSSLVTNSATYQTRYIELDGSGLPTGDYVVLPKQDFAGASQSPVTYEDQFTLYDPATYAPSSAGNYAQGSGSLANTASTLVQTAAAQILPAAAVETTEYTIAMVLREPCELTPMPFSGTQFRGIEYRLLNSANTQGIRLRFETIADASFNPDKGFDRIQVYSGSSGTAWGTLSISYTYTQASSFSWFHTGEFALYSFAISYDPPSGRQKARVYRNGTLLGTLTSPASSFALFPEPHLFRLYNPWATTTLNVAIDDIRVYERALSTGEIAALYNSGNYTYSPGTESDIVASWNFQAKTGANFTNNSNLVAANLNGTGWTVTANGVVPQAAAGLTPKKGKYRIELQRLDAEDTSTLSESQLDWSAISLVSFGTYRYPGAALLALKIRANEQLNGGVPRITVPVRGRKCPVWDGSNVNLPTYSYQWTSNPAWVALDLLTSTEYGLGLYHDLATDIDVASFQEWADYCDEPVPNGIQAIDWDGYGYTYGYSAGVVTWTLTGVTSMQNVKVGDQVTFETNIGAIADYATNGTEVYEITSSTWDSGTSTLTIVANWPDGKASPSPTGGSGTVTSPFYVKMSQTEVRFRYDGVLDRANGNGWEVLVQVCQTARATPVRYGKRVSVIVDKPRDPVALITQGSVIEGSFSNSYSGIKDRPNAVAIEILDRDDNYKRKLVEREHSTLVDPAAGEQYRHRRFRLEGVTRKGQAMREATYQLNAAHLIRRAVSFDLSPDGLYLQPGDRIQVAHDVPQWGYSGRLRSGSTATGIVIDREIVLASATSYEVTVQNPSTNVVVTKSISSGAGTYAAGSTLVCASLGFAPAEHTKYSIGVAAASVKDFQVTNVSLDPETLFRTIEAIEYDEQVYDDDFGDILDSPSALETPLPEFELPEAALALSASESPDENSDGSLTNGLNVTWQNEPTTVRALGSSEVWIQPSNLSQPIKVGTVTRGATSFRVNSSELLQSTSGTVYVRQVNRAGNGRPVKASSSTTYTILDRVTWPSAPATVGVAQRGDQATYVWTGVSERRANQVEFRYGGWLLGQPAIEAPAFAPGEQESGMIVAPEAGEPAMPLYGRVIGKAGQPGPAAVSSTHSLELPGETVHAVEFQNASPTWVDPNLTKTNVSVVTVGPLSLPVIEISGSNTNGLLDYDFPQLDEPQWVYVSIGWEGESLAAEKWEDATYSWGDYDGQRRTWEGVIFGGHEDNQGTVRASFGTTTDGTQPAVANMTAFRPGLYFLKDARFRMRLSRPNTNCNVRLSRLFVNMARPHTYRQSGTSFPTSPWNGQKFFRSDIGETFYWDGSRSKWLSEALYPFEFLSLTAKTNAYLAFEDASFPGSATVGFTAAFDICCVGISGLTPAPSTFTAELRDDGVSSATLAWSAATRRWSDTINGSTIAAGSNVSMYINGTCASACQITALTRRVAT